MRTRTAIVSALVLLAVIGNIATAAEIFLAVGYGGRRMISTDGINWEITAEWAQPGGDDGNNLMSAAFAQDKFVVVGGGGGGNTGAGHILVSKDGREWREVHKDRARVNPVVYGNGRFVVGTSSYPSGKLMWSEDAETWQPGAQISERGLTHFRGGEFGGGLFVLVGNGSRAAADGERVNFHWAIASPDGQKIVSERTDLPGHGRIVFGAGKFLMLTSHSEADVIASADGNEWKPVPVAEGVKFNWLVRTEREFLIGNGKEAYRSADGAEWTKADINLRAGVHWSDGTRFITSSWPGKMGFSPDGKTWQLSPPQTANGINRVVRGTKP